MIPSRSLATRRAPRDFPFGPVVRLVLASAAVACLAALAVAATWPPAPSEALGKQAAVARANARPGPGTDRDRGQPRATSPIHDLKSTPWLGVRVQNHVVLVGGQNASSSAAADVEGAMLVDVVPGSPADLAELQSALYLNRRRDGTITQLGDVIVAVDRVRIKSADDLASYLARSGKRVGDEVTIRIVRADQVFDVLVWLRARDDAQADQVGAI